MLFLHLYKFFKLCSSKLWLFLQFDCLKYYDDNGKVKKVFYEKISDNQGKDLDSHMHKSLAKGYG